MAPARDLRPPGICNDLRHEPQTHRLRLKQGKILLTLNLQRNLRLALPLPAAQDRGVGRVTEEVLVAGESGMGTLGSNFTCGES